MTCGFALHKTKSSSLNEIICSFRQTEIEKYRFRANIRLLQINLLLTYVLPSSTRSIMRNTTQYLEIKFIQIRGMQMVIHWEFHSCGVLKLSFRARNTAIVLSYM